MPLNVSQLNTDIKNALTGGRTGLPATQVSQINTLANALATAIENFVLTLDITYTTGMVAPSGGGPVTGVLGNTLS